MSSLGYNIQYMLGNLLKQTTNQLTLTLKQSIVIRYPKRKSPFDTTSYNPEWIPRQKPYHKLRKPSMPIWTDPNNVVPYMIPPMRRKCHPKTYLKKVIEAEEMEKSMRKKLYILEPVRPGDIVDITFQQTYESQNLTTHRGFVVAFKRRGQLTAGIQLAVRMGGVNVKALYLIHSPKFKDIKIVSRGSGNFKANIKKGWEVYGKSYISRPLLRNRVMKNRANKLRVKIRRGHSMDYDTVKSNNVKRIIKM